MIENGELRRLIDEDGLHGITSNPSLFEKAIAESNLYDNDIQNLILKKKMLKKYMKLSALMISGMLLMNSGPYMKSQMEEADMSAWKLILILLIILQALLRKLNGYGALSTVPIFL